MTYIELVQRYFPSSTEDQALSILWSCTPFPCGSVRDNVRCLREARRAGDGTAEGALKWAHEQADLIFDEYMRQQADQCPDQ